MRVAVYDAAWWGGHHPVFVDGVVDELVALGHEVHVRSGNAPKNAAVATWTDVPHVPIDRVRAGRRDYRDVARWARAAGADSFVDLFLDRTLARVPAAIDALPAPTFVLHDASPLLREQASIRRRVRHVLSSYAARRVGRRSEARVVVHTAAAGAALARVGVDAVQAPVPIRALPPVATIDGEGAYFAFIGDGRPDKGLDRAIAAVARVGSRLRISGPLGAREEQLLAEHRDAPVEHLGFLDDGELVQLLAGATAVVLPYSKRLAASGVASTVMLEAVACGCPVVVPSFLAAQLPHGFTGAEPYDARGDAALATALERASAHAPQRRAAARAASGDVRARHSFATYVRALLGATNGVFDGEGTLPR